MTSSNMNSPSNAADATLKRRTKVIGRLIGTSSALVSFALAFEAIRVESIAGFLLGIAGLVCSAWFAVNYEGK